MRFLDKIKEQELLTTLHTRARRIKGERESANLFRQRRDYPLLSELRDFNYVDHLEPIVLIAMNTDFRIGELLSLRWENVDLVNDFLTVDGASAKSGKSRHIPLNQNSKQAFKNWLADVY